MTDPVTPPEAIETECVVIGAGPSGLFANQNSQATFLVIGIVALITLALMDKRARKWRPAFVAAGAFLVVCVLMTGSRAGTTLLIVPALLIVAVVGTVVLTRRQRGGVSK